ncbi:uncharacterized protein A4U43_C02F200 [Asparagus officinalis]|uniref:Uncharacterized protein n=1 Tax=Asparagus officinalis TaxID=4686 RepID=A0A5P1FGI1_ASPOF|nr:uncharacterized protein LOC109829766 [Asparagus officinalis]ONK76823.1 uncharacterized protein A4U43_C02F200 [Asparagus officinalis]
MVPPCLEMKANRVDLPLSLRIIKRKKKRWEEGVREAGESACCSIKKAFSSMVFIVRELHSYTLQMREALFYENLEGILARVQGEMNASFVWLFQQIFSCTPTFMVYVMLLLANFTVYSIGHNSAFAAVSPCSPTAVEHEHQQTENQNSRFDAPSIKSFNVVGRTASVGGGGSGGGKVKPVAGATDGDGSHSSYVHRIIPADGISASTGVEESGSVMEEEEMDAWRRIVEEATKMQASSRDETLMDSGTLQQLVSPVTVGLEPEDHADYSETELMYRRALSQDPDNVLLLSNFAQFLFLVLHDHDRAEYFFKRASEKKPGDAEALCRYAMFLWQAREDLEAAEEAYLEAIAADPSNSHYAANYAHFLWNTGGEDTCYPLDGSDAC